MSSRERQLVIEVWTIRTFYRVVKTNPPTLPDFTSNMAKGKPIPPSPPRERHWMWDGLSAYDTEERAHPQAREVPRLGGFIARLDLPENAPIEIAQTGGEGHHTLRGDPQQMLDCVVSIVPVRPQKG